MQPISYTLNGRLRIGISCVSAGLLGDDIRVATSTRSWTNLGAFNALGIGALRTVPQHIKLKTPG